MNAFIVKGEGVQGNCWYDRNSDEFDFFFFAFNKYCKKRKRMLGSTRKPPLALSV